METRNENLTSSPMSLPEVRSLYHSLADRLQMAVLGRSDVIELLLIALFADGHVLLEDYPGSGKTTLAATLGEALDTPQRAFRRIQFTPDLLPSDITGVSVFEPDSGKFSFRKGPIFANVVLADEINRTSPKVQAAMLEAMAEKQVTVDNHTYALDALFFVIATQNPLDVAGTYPLPTPQLDRFLFKLEMNHISNEAEREVLARYPLDGFEQARTMPRIEHERILHARYCIRQEVKIAPAIRNGLVEFASKVRADARVRQGVSTRALVLALPALQARAALDGRDHVLPEDFKALALPIFAHRVDVLPGQSGAKQVVDECIKPVMEGLARHSLVA